MPARARSSAATRKAENVYFLYGDDEAQLKETAAQLVRSITPPDAGDFGLEVIDGAAEHAEHAARICQQAVEALQTLPFFGGGKVVWLKNVNFLADTQTGRAAATLEGLEALLQVLEAGLPSDVKLVVTAFEVDKRRTFFQKLEKLAQTQVFDAPDTSQRGWEAQAEEMASSRARELGLTFEPEALELFVLMVGSKTREIVNELEKLDLYLGSARRIITVQDVRTLISATRESVVFELGNFIGSRDLRQALILLERLLQQGENAVGILLAAIVPKVRQLLLAADLVARHKLPLGSYPAFLRALEALPPEETSHLPRKKDGTGFNVYPLFLSAQHCRAYTVEELRAALRACLQANLRLVSTGLDPKTVLTQLLVSMLSPRALTAKRA